MSSINPSRRPPKTAKRSCGSRLGWVLLVLLTCVIRYCDIASLLRQYAPLLSYDNEAPSPSSSSITIIPSGLDVDVDVDADADTDTHKFIANDTFSSMHLKFIAEKNQTSPLSQRVVESVKSIGTNTNTNKSTNTDSTTIKTIESGMPTVIIVLQNRISESNQTQTAIAIPGTERDQKTIQSTDNDVKTNGFSDSHDQSPDPSNSKVLLFPVQRVDNYLDENKLILQPIHVPVPNRNKENMFSMTKPILAIIAATRSTSHWKNVSHTQLQRHLLPSLQENVTAEEIDEWDIRLYLAVDDDDMFWMGNNKTQWLTLQIPSYLTVHVYSFPRHVQGHIPFNEIAAVAYKDGAAYFCRINDDSSFITTQWISQAVNALKSYNPPNVGVVGPTCYEGNNQILTHDFVHRTHLEIFNGEYYPSIIDNWCLDDWITDVYSAQTLGKNLQRSTKLKTWIVRHWASTPRYMPKKPSPTTMDDLYSTGRKKILHYIEHHVEHVKPQLQA